MSPAGFLSKVVRVLGIRARSMFLEPRDRVRKAVAARYSKETPGVPLREFADVGWYVFKRFCDEAEVKRLRSRYLREETQQSHDGNVHVPFFDQAFMRHFYESAAWRLLASYGKTVYGLEPVLQMYPTLLLTKPTFAQGDFDGKKHNVPASFHTDYPTELTVHIPLTDIVRDTNHTRFCTKSHRALNVRAQRRYSPTKADLFEQVHLLANAGDLLAIDVTGIHRADVVRDSIRIMIQLKFTAPRYLHQAADWSVVGSKARLARVFTADSAVFDEDLQSSLLFDNARGINREAVHSFLSEY